MRAIILAAGSGNRLRPLTNERPKCLVPLYGRPILDYSLEAIGHVNIHDVTIVTGYRADAIQELGLPTRHNARFSSTNMVHSLFCAEDLFDDDILISYGDIVYGRQVLETTLAAAGDFVVTVDRRWRELWEMRMEDPLADAETLRLDDQGRILELGKKPQTLAEIQGQYIGLIMIRRVALDLVCAYYHEMDRNALYDGKDFDNMYLTSFIQAVIDHVMPVTAAFVEGGWVEVDSVEDLETYTLRESEIRRRLSGYQGQEEIHGDS